MPTRSSVSTGIATGACSPPPLQNLILATAEMVANLRYEVEGVPVCSVCSRASELGKSIVHAEECVVGRVERAAVAAAKGEPVRVIRLGLGENVSNWGSHRGVPAVFLEPVLGAPGAVGDRLDRDREPQIRLNSVSPGGLILELHSPAGAAVLIEDLVSALIRVAKAAPAPAETLKEFTARKVREAAPPPLVVSDIAVGLLAPVFAELYARTYPGQPKQSKSVPEDDLAAPVESDESWEASSALLKAGVLTLDEVRALGIAPVRVEPDPDRERRVTCGHTIAIYGKPDRTTLLCDLEPGHGDAFHSDRASRISWGNEVYEIHVAPSGVMELRQLEGEPMFVHPAATDVEAGR